MLFVKRVYPLFVFSRSGKERGFNDQFARNQWLAARVVI
jgi:hypothetical protein